MGDFEGIPVLASQFVPEGYLYVFTNPEAESITGMSGPVAVIRVEA